jgi:hypothetical protein
MTQIWALRSRLEKQPTDLRRRHHYLRDGTLGNAQLPWSDGEASLRLTRAEGPAPKPKGLQDSAQGFQPWEPTTQSAAP